MPSVPIVEQDLFLAMGGLAWAFTIQKRVDPATGAVIPVPWNEFSDLLIAKPVKFQFDAILRGGEDKRAELRTMWKAANEESEELVVAADGTLPVVGTGEEKVEGGDVSESESDNEVLIDVRESSAEPSESGL